jgi:hypothetical protein
VNRPRLRQAARRVAGLLPLLGLLAACSALDEPAEAPGGEERPDQVFLDSRIELQEHGRLRASLQSRRMEQFRRRHLVVLTDSVLSVSWDSLGRLESTIDCDTMRFARDKRDLEARGRVRVAAVGDEVERRRIEGAADPLAQLRRDPPLLLLTSALDYIHRTGRIQTDSTVVFITRQDTLHGRGFRSDRNLRNWEIREPTGVTRRSATRRAAP